MLPTLKKELDLDSSDVPDDLDLVISIGGDSTFLQSAGLIDSPDIPILGINSDPLRRKGFLTNIEIEHKFMNKQIDMLIDNL